MPTKVNGGVITDQMLTGSLRYFKMSGNFAGTVSPGTVAIDSTSAGDAATYYFLVGSSDTPRPVPGSLADLALRTIMDKCTVVEIGLVGAPGAETEVHFSAANTSFGWLDDAGETDVVAMQDAIAALGATITVPSDSGSVDDNTATPVTTDVSTAVTITQVPFILA